MSSLQENLSQKFADNFCYFFLLGEFEFSKVWNSECRNFFIMFVSWYLSWIRKKTLIYFFLFDKFEISSSSRRDGMGRVEIELRSICYLDRQERSMDDEKGGKRNNWSVQEKEEKLSIENLFSVIWLEIVVWYIQSHSNENWELQHQKRIMEKFLFWHSMKEDYCELKWRNYLFIFRYPLFLLWFVVVGDFPPLTKFELLLLSIVLRILKILK